MESTEKPNKQVNIIKCGVITHKIMCNGVEWWCWKQGSTLDAMQWCVELEERGKKSWIGSIVL